MQINVCNLSLASTTYFTKKVKGLTCHDVEAKIQSLSSSLLLFAQSYAQHRSLHSSSDQAITLLSVLGTVTELKGDTREVVVTTAAGSKVILTLSDSTVFMRIPPGEKTKDKFIKITATDFGVGDSVFARGRISEDRKTMPAREFYVMSKGEIADKRDREREAWRTRGIAGTITALKAEASEITIDARTAEGPKPIVISANTGTKYRRYAPNSVRFSDSKRPSQTWLSVIKSARWGPKTQMAPVSLLMKLFPDRFRHLPAPSARSTPARAN
jgi:hypothetical protein